MEKKVVDLGDDATFSPTKRKGRKHTTKQYESKRVTTRQQVSQTRPPSPQEPLVGTKRKNEGTYEGPSKKKKVQLDLEEDSQSSVVLSDDSHYIPGQHDKKTQEVLDFLKEKAVENPNITFTDIFDDVAIKFGPSYVVAYKSKFSAYFSQYTIRQRQRLQKDNNNTHNLAPNDIKELVQERIVVAQEPIKKDMKELAQTVQNMECKINQTFKKASEHEKKTKVFILETGPDMIKQEVKKAFTKINAAIDKMKTQLKKLDNEFVELASKVETIEAQFGEIGQKSDHEGDEGPGKDTPIEVSSDSSLSSVTEEEKPPRKNPGDETDEKDKN